MSKLDKVTDKRCDCLKYLDKENLFRKSYIRPPRTFHHLLLHWLIFSRPHSVRLLEWRILNNMATNWNSKSWWKILCGSWRRCGSGKSRLVELKTSYECIYNNVLDQHCKHADFAKIFIGRCLGIDKLMRSSVEVIPGGGGFSCDGTCETHQPNKAIMAEVDWRWASDNLTWS